MSEMYWAPNMPGYKLAMEEAFKEESSHDVEVEEPEEIEDILLPKTRTEAFNYLVDNFEILENLEEQFLDGKIQERNRFCRTLQLNPDFKVNIEGLKSNVGDWNFKHFLCNLKIDNLRSFYLGVEKYKRLNKKNKKL